MPIFSQRHNIYFSFVDHSAILVHTTKRFFILIIFLLQRAKFNQLNFYFVALFETIESSRFRILHSIRCEKITVFSS